jgi:hypothetical protein
VWCSSRTWVASPSDISDRLNKPGGDSSSHGALEGRSSQQLHQIFHVALPLTDLIDRLQHFLGLLVSIDGLHASSELLLDSVPLELGLRVSIVVEIGTAVNIES